MRSTKSRTAAFGPVPAREASRAAQQEVARKTATSSRLTLPGKLSDCLSHDREDIEIFIVEGDSAGGSAKQGRDRSSHSSQPNSALKSEEHL
ncbi:MAG: hypothetical protein M3541_13730 [Acidobacteriota bacterium]|nr:hypothetical protein [Acidobacteriota bacterium]